MDVDLVQHNIETPKKKNGKSNGVNGKRYNYYKHVQQEDDKFVLDDSFLEQYVTKKPAWGPVGYITYKRTYARDLETVPQRHQLLAEKFGVENNEEWWLTVCRVVEGTYQFQQRHCKQLHLPWYPDKAQRSAQEMYDLIFNFKFSPPGRGLWMMGTDYVTKAGGAALNNCAFVSTAEISVSFSAPFTFLMDMSMLGVGVGGDTRGAGTVTLQKPVLDQTPHVVPDNREGWVDLIRRCLDAFVGDDTWPACIDYSQVRGPGSLIKGFGGRSSGHMPLAQLVDDIWEVLTPQIDKSITSTNIVDLFNMVGRCVVAGNIRRSAEILFGEPADPEFLELKDYKKNPVECKNWRWASNNSVWGKVGMDYSEVAQRTALNGEPGYEWLDNAREFSRMGREADGKDRAAMGGNPCLEQTLESFELCCLVETYPSLHSSYEEYERTLKFAYLYAKTVTLVPTHDSRTNAVMLRNRRIGCSQSGIVQSMKRHGRRTHFNWCNQGYDRLKKWDDVYSRWLCVPPSIKITSVKPSGTVSLLAGVTPGIHYPHSEYYFRVIRFSSNSRLLEPLHKAGYRCVELENEPNTVAVYFPVKEKFFDRSKTEVSMWEQLEMAAQMQHYWADNQVSVTVTFNKDEAKSIKYALELYETRLKGVSFLPESDHGYDHAPYQRITERMYDHYVSQLKPLELGGNTHEVVEKFCDGEACTLSGRAE